MNTGAFYQKGKLKLAENIREWLIDGVELHEWVVFPLVKSPLHYPQVRSTTYQILQKEFPNLSVKTKVTVSKDHHPQLEVLFYKSDERVKWENID